MLIDQLADLVAGTLADLGKGAWTDLTTDLQEFIVLPKIMKKEKVKFQGGKGLQWNVKMSTAGNSRNVGFFETDVATVADSMVQANCGWAHNTSNYSFDLKEEAINSASAVQIFDLIKSRRADAYVDLATLFEQNFWGVADTSNNKKPLGVKNWLCYSATPGFNGTVPSGFTDCAGINPTTYPRWRNYTAQYTNATKADLIAKVRVAMDTCMFKSPLDPVPPDYRRNDRRSMYTTLATKQALEVLAEQQNDNLGNDLASKDGLVTIRKVPVEWAPYLEAETTAVPFVGIDWGVFYPVFLSGRYMIESQGKNFLSHEVLTMHVDTSYGYVCRDRRANFLIAKAGW